MRNDFIQNLRNTPGIVRNPLNEQRLNFTRQTPFYDGRAISIKNLDNAERLFGISERSDNALMDRGEDRKRIENIPPLRVEDKTNEGSRFEASGTGESPYLMNIWRLDGQPFNLNSYLNSVERVINDVESSKDEKALLSALKRGYNEWGLNAHVLGNTLTRTNDLYDSTAATLVRYLYDDVKNNKNGDDFETLKYKSVQELRDQFIPKWISEKGESI